MKNYKPLSREEVISVIEGKSTASRIPILLQFWTHPEEFGEREQQVRKIMNAYPEDALIISLKMPDVYKAPTEFPEYRWLNREIEEGEENAGLDARVAIRDWNELDDILKAFPDPYCPILVPRAPEDDNRYRLAHWWYGLFERHWQLRGMTNALMDYYIDPDSVHRLFRAVTDFYLVAIERAKKELNADGIFTSDDLGTQNGPFFSGKIFDEFFRPYYEEIIGKAHSLGMHFWLHACGNIEEFLPRFIELGLDVIHPIQKYTMDERKIAQKYGKDICIWAGFDVQQTIPWGTADEVRREVRHIIDTYCRPKGRFMFTAGNGINGDCPIESLRALYEESFEYGWRKVLALKSDTVV